VKAGLLAGRGAPDAFDPSDIAGLDLWIDVSDASTITFGTGTDVAQIDDKSGNGYHFTQATGAAQPPRDGTQNSLATLQFDGVNHFIASSTGFTFHAHPRTVFFAGKRVSGYTNIATGPDAAPGIALHGTTGIILLDKQNVANLYSGGTGVATNTFFVFSMTFTTTSASAWIDGVADQTDGYGTTFTGGSQIAWGAGRPDGSFKGGGEAGELLIYDTVLSAGDREDVETYLMDKWGV
jgi:hypothetical protein